jgi:hypothetical protein
MLIFAEDTLRFLRFQVELAERRLEDVRVDLREAEHAAVDVRKVVEESGMLLGQHPSNPAEA